MRSHVDERRLVQEFVACLADVVHTWFGCCPDSAASAVPAGMGAGRLGPWLGLLDVNVEEPRLSDLGAFRQSKRVLDVDAEVPDRALNLRVPEQDLNGAKISGLLVDDGRFGPPQRVRPVIFPA